MHHEPSGLVGDVDGSMELVSGETFLARSHEMRRINPLVERNLGILENRADRDCEVTLTTVALVQAHPVALAFQLRDALYAPAVGADRATRPTNGFEMLPRFVGIAKYQICKVNRHIQPPRYASYLGFMSM